MMMLIESTWCRLTIVLLLYTYIGFSSLERPPPRVDFGLEFAVENGQTDNLFGYSDDHHVFSFTHLQPKLLDQHTGLPERAINFQSSETVEVRWTRNFPRKGIDMMKTSTVTKDCLYITNSTL